MANDVVVVIGSGGIGVAIARRQGFGKAVLLADFNEKVLCAAADAMKDASYSVETQVCGRHVPGVGAGTRRQGGVAGPRHAGGQHRGSVPEHGAARQGA